MVDTSDPAVAVEGLAKNFGEVVALDGLDLEVEAGTVFGLLGPNGAGKTTLVRVLATLLEPTAGRAAVLGHDVVAEPLAVRRRIGLAGQFAAVDAELTGRENVEMIARLYRFSSSEARRRTRDVLERFELVEAADRRVSTYSGGMRRRLDLAAGLIGRPRWCYSTSPRPALTLGPVRNSGRSSTTCGVKAPQCCSRPSTWRRPIASPSESRWSTTGGSPPRARRPS
jgi:ABC-type Na+ transport system ATPase subunit NatA